jgi:hypothetical protein
MSLGLLMPPADRDMRILCRIIIVCTLFLASFGTAIYYKTAQKIKASDIKSQYIADQLLKSEKGASTINIYDPNTQTVVRYVCVGVGVTGKDLLVVPVYVEEKNLDTYLDKARINVIESFYKTKEQVL